MKRFMHDPHSSSEPFIGIQMAAESVLLEGAGNLLDQMREHAGANTILIGTHGGGYGGNDTIARQNWADHGTPPAPLPEGKGPSSYIDYHPEYYKGTFLGQERRPGEHRFADRDVLRETLEAARPRGMQVYARHLEGFHPSKAMQMRNFAKVAQVDCYGRREAAPCWNHPDYRAWWLSMSEEWCKEYEIDGLILGPERDAPLAPLLYGVGTPTCFCEHCREIGQRRGYDLEDAKAGYRQLYELMQAKRTPTDGMLISVLRIFFKHPAVVAWQKFMNNAKWSLHAEIYGTIKALRPHMQVGWMVPVYPLMTDIFSRALCYDYAEMAPWSDFLKLNTYQDVNAARLHVWIQRATQFLYRDLEPSQLQQFLYAIFGYDRESEPDYATSRDAPFSPAYVKREVTRCKEAVVNHPTKVYAGIGVDIPHENTKPTTYEDQYAATYAAFEAGADGLLLSREWEFMTFPTLQASRDATLAARKAGLCG